MRVEPAELQRRLHSFADAARRAGVKLTQQRLEIFRAVAGSAEHPTAEALFQAVRPSMPTVSLDTVYRTLWLLKDLGLLNTLGPRQDSVRFDANLAPHHHFRCTACGMVRDFESSELDHLPIPAAARRFGQVSRAHIEVEGLCAACAAKTASTTAGAAKLGQESPAGKMPPPPPAPVNKENDQ